ncbi:hypothetical protein [Planococcus lenghuensis]|uniref:Uncharacterized protein n=1 Tax=Planococcus lenghuensis TaxID=2213202 RepID=A0A1Q2KW68_9BACL|nr:hypothetical protein [Planococcus lenghuensis]AQQ52458.1 hypothetical protein B0X71_04585 [Planococcus lenghuensis]
MNKHMKTAIGSMAIAGLLVSGGVGVTAHEDGGGGRGELTHKEKIAVKKATARYHSLKQAEKAGYINTEECVEVPGLGGMGIHFVNPALVDNEVDMAKPEALLYVPTKGGLKLIGVEYLSIDENELFGELFDPPSAVPQHSLHAWVWQDNPAGDFAPFNPNISCPE